MWMKLFPPTTLKMRMKKNLFKENVGIERKTMDSLCSPNDYLKKMSSTVEPLDHDSLEKAMRHLNQNVEFLQVDRYYADPVQMNQLIGLVSFVPSKEAIPDKDGIYGMMKVRGVYATDREANERAEFLIRNVDSFHDIYHVHVGRPFPITNSEKYSNEIKNIDIRKKTTQIISEDIVEKKRQEQKDMQEMKDREQQLLAESKRAQNDEPRDTFEEYITENVKRAQLIWTYHETKKKMDQMRLGFQKATERIQELDDSYPLYKDQYHDKYMEARRESGIPDDNDSFIQYLGLDLSISLEDAISISGST